MNAINHDIFQPTFHYGTKELLTLWAFGHLKQLVPEFERPTKKIDAKYSGEYGLILRWTNKNKEHLIKIEVKASRANDRKRKEEPLIIKAIASDSKRHFLMNFQQQKPKCCDVFIWIAVYRDQIKYWVIHSNEVQTNQYLTPQHRNALTAKRKKGYKKEDIYEGQIMVTDENISYFDKYLTTGKQLREAAIAQYKIQQKIK
jgi:hypothetical protein